MVSKDGIEPPTPGFSVRLGTRKGNPHPSSNVSIRTVTRLSRSIHNRWRRVPPNETVQVRGKSRDLPRTVLLAREGDQETEALHRAFWRMVDIKAMRGKSRHPLASSAPVNATSVRTLQRRSPQEPQAQHSQHLHAVGASLSRSSPECVARPVFTRSDGDGVSRWPSAP